MFRRRRWAQQQVSETFTGTSETASVVTAEQGWKLLSVVNDWIRFADAKAGAVLAFSAGLGTMLYNVVKNVPHTHLLLDVSVVATCAFLVSAVLLAGLTIVPRTRDKDVVPDEISNLFFASIARNYKGQRLAYREQVKRLSIDAEALLVELADQIHANAAIATAKTDRVKWAIRSVITAGLLVGLVAIQVGLL